MCVSINSVSKRHLKGTRRDLIMLSGLDVHFKDKSVEFKVHLCLAPLFNSLDRCQMSDNKRISTIKA